LNNIDLINNQVWSLLFEDASSELDNYPNKRPLLAHYTSIEVLEKILSTDEIWFSNPLYMNDFEEIRFGVGEGFKAFSENQSIYDACVTKDRYDILRHAYAHYHDQFVFNHAIDVYAFCLSEHNEEDYLGGRLSMWRGYGGNGKGAAIIFDLKQLNPIHDSPFVVSKVHYKSTAERRDWLTEKIEELALFLKTSEIPDDALHVLAHQLFERFKLASLFTKHNGFKEEKEWRVVYMKERDPDNKYPPTFAHLVTTRGVEPKLRYKIAPIAGISDDMSLSNLIYKIILGPTLSDYLALQSMQRMFDNLKKPDLKGKVIASNIPFRA
jgi:hypothetical protein